VISVGSPDIFEAAKSGDVALVAGHLAARPGIVNVRDEK
jgi:hypothetical protein